MSRIIVTEITECSDKCPFWYIDTMAHAMCRKKNKRLPLFSFEKPYWCPVDRVEETVEEVTEFCTDVVKSIALAVERYCIARGIE